MKLKTVFVVCVSYLLTGLYMCTNLPFPDYGHMCAFSNKDRFVLIYCFKDASLL